MPPCKSWNYDWPCLRAHLLRWDSALTNSLLSSPFCPHHSCPRSNSLPLCLIVPGVWLSPSWLSFLSFHHLTLPHIYYNVAYSLKTPQWLNIANRQFFSASLSRSFILGAQPGSLRLYHCFLAHWRGSRNTDYSLSPRNAVLCPSQHLHIAYALPASKNVLPSPSAFWKLCCSKALPESHLLQDTLSHPSGVPFPLNPPKHFIFASLMTPIKICLGYSYL